MKSKLVMSEATYNRLVTDFIEANDPQLMFDPNEGCVYTD